jgi:uncharacterized protein (TIGR03437 family)
VPAGKSLSGAAATTNSVSLLIGTTAANPSFTGLNQAGLYQINLTIPAALASGELPLTAIVGGVQTEVGVVIPLQ